MLGITGISYKSAPLEIREKYSFTEEASLRFLNQLQIDPNLRGALVLSTCNRIEVYYHFENYENNAIQEIILRNLEFHKKIGQEERKYFYHYTGEQTIDHLFGVVSGLESLIIGEDQIVTQVKSAFKFSLDNGMSSPIITRMFNKAFEAGKRVRTETNISQGSASLSSAAVELMFTKVPDITQRNILVIGTGIMGELALVNLKSRDCNNIHITNRTFSKATALAEKFNVQAFEMERLAEFVPKSDIIIVATGAQHHILNREIIESYGEKTVQNQLFMDLSVPRNISTNVKELSNVQLYAVDDLQEIVKKTQNKRKEAVTEAKEIIFLVRQEFTDWLFSLELTPSILKIQKNLASVNDKELEGFLKINGISEDEFLIRYGEHISRKFARLFISNVKKITDNGKNKSSLDLVNQLFDLNGSAK